MMILIIMMKVQESVQNVLECARKACKCPTLQNLQYIQNYRHVSKPANRLVYIITPIIEFSFPAELLHSPVETHASVCPSFQQNTTTHHIT